MKIQILRDCKVNEFSFVAGGEYLVDAWVGLTAVNSGRAIDITPKAKEAKEKVEVKVEVQKKSKK